MAIVLEALLNITSVDGEKKPNNMHSGFKYDAFEPSPTCQKRINLNGHMTYSIYFFQINNPKRVILPVSCWAII